MDGVKSNTAPAHPCARGIGAFYSNPVGESRRGFYSASLAPQSIHAVQRLRPGVASRSVSGASMYHFACAAPAGSDPNRGAAAMPAQGPGGDAPDSSASRLAQSALSPAIRVFCLRIRGALASATGRLQRSGRLRPFVRLGLQGPENRLACEESGKTYRLPQFVR